MAFKGEGFSLGRNPYVDQSRIQRYGFRPMEIGTTLIPSLTSDSADLGATAKPEIMEMAAELNEWLWRAFADNDRFLNGSLTIKGAISVQPGQYVQLRTIDREFYATDVNHNFSVESGQVKTN